MHLNSRQARGERHVDARSLTDEQCLPSRVVKWDLVCGLHRSPISRIGKLTRVGRILICVKTIEENYGDKFIIVFFILRYVRYK